MRTFILLTFRLFCSRSVKVFKHPAHPLLRRRSAQGGHTVRVPYFHTFDLWPVGWTFILLGLKVRTFTLLTFDQVKCEGQSLAALNRFLAINAARDHPFLGGGG